MFSTSMIKLSLLSFYLRLSAGPTLAKPFRRLVWLTIVIVIAFCGAYLLCLVLACRPLRSFWLAFDYAWAQENEYYCDSEGITLLTATAVSVLLDFTIVLLPIMLLWHLDIPRIQKFGIAGIFAMGTFTCVAGLIRIKYVYVSFYETWDATCKSLPFSRSRFWTCGPQGAHLAILPLNPLCSGDLYDLFIWTEIEVLMASICGSAPALKVFFRNSSILPTTITTQNKTSGNSSVVTSLRHRHYRFPKLLRTGTATPTTTSAPSSNATINGDTEDIVTILDEKYSDVGKNDSVANKELCSNDSIDAVSTIGSMRQPSPPSFQKPVGPSAALERKTSKLSFDSIACYGRNNDGEGVEKMRSVRSFEAPREGRVGIKRNQSFEIGGARSRASLLGEVRIERMVEVVLEDRDGDEGNLGVRGGELNFG